MRAALAVLGVLAALAASGSATVEQATAAGMPGPVPLALVVLLEVVNVAGTWTWLTDARTRVQVEAACGVAAASSVTAICGVLSYGPIGLVAPAGVLFTVHLVGRLQHRDVPARRHAVSPDVRPESARSHAVTPPGQGVSTPVDAPPVEPVVELPPDPPTAPSPVSPPGPAAARPDLTEDDMVAALAARPVTPGRDAVRDEFGIGAGRADRIRKAADAARRPRLVTEAAR